MPRPDDEDGAPIRRLLWVMGIAVALVAGVGVWSASSARAPVEVDACEDEENVMREFWTDEVRLDLASRVDALGSEHDGNAIVGAFGEYFDRWQWTRTDLCRRAEAKGQEYDPRSPGGRCLQRRIEQFAAAVDLIRDGEPEVAEAAPKLVAALEDPAPCLDEQATRYDLPMPSRPESLVHALAVQQRLAEIELLRAGGLHERARKRVEEIEEAATHVTHLPSLAEYELVRLTTLDAEARRQPAELLRMTKAVALADRAGADPIAARLLVLQLEALGPDHPSAPTLEILAQGKIDRCGDPVAAAALERWRRSAK